MVTNVTPTGKVRPLWERSFHYRGPRTGAESEFIGWTTPPSPGEVDPAKAGYRVEMSTKNRWTEWRQIASQRQIFWITHQDWDSDIKQLDDACRELPTANLAMLEAHTHENRED